MHHYITFILLVLTGEILAEDAPLLPEKVFRSDLEGVMSLYTSRFSRRTKSNGFLQYDSSELIVEQYPRFENTLVITCANEGSKCKYYDTVQQTWKETNGNKIFFNGEIFFDMFEVIRLEIQNEFLLLLTMEKKHRIITDHSFLMTYKALPDFLAENTEICNEDAAGVDLKAIYVNDTVPDQLNPHRVFQSMLLLDARVRQEEESVTIMSISGIFSGSRFLAIRRLELHEYLSQYSHQGYKHEHHVMSVTPGVVKQDLASLDPENRCQKGNIIFVGLLEYNKELLYEVYCENKKYEVSIRVRYDLNEFDATLKCPKQVPGKREPCSFSIMSEKDAAKRSRAIKRTLTDDHRLVLIRPKSRSAIFSKLAGAKYPIVHYFQLDDFFQFKLLAMQKMLRISRGSDCKVSVLMPSSNRDFTVPLTFDCQNNVVEIGKDGSLVVLDDDSMEHLTVEKLTFNLETKEFKSPGVGYRPGDPKAIRLDGTWQSVPTLKQRAVTDFTIVHIMDGLKALRQQYLEAAAMDPGAKRALQLNGNVLLVMHGETAVNDVKAVVTKANILCEYSWYDEVYFTGEEILAKNYVTSELETLDPAKCRVVNKNLEGEDSSVKGLWYWAEDDVALFMKTFTGTITGRCHWYDLDTVFRYVIYDAVHQPVFEGLFDCSLEIYFMKGPFRVLSESRSMDAVENFFVFGQEGVLVTATDAFAVETWDGRTIDAGLMGPPIKCNEEWAIALQLVS